MIRPLLKTLTAFSKDGLITYGIMPTVVVYRQNTHSWTGGKYFSSSRPITSLDLDIMPLSLNVSLSSASSGRSRSSVSSKLSFVELSIRAKVPLISRICKFYLSQSLFPFRWWSLTSLRQLWVKATQVKTHAVVSSVDINQILRSLWSPPWNNSDRSLRHSAANITMLVR